MLHPRQQVREAIFEALSGKTAAENRVFKSQITPPEDVYPFINIFTLTEDVDGEGTNYREKRDMTVTLEVTVVGGETYAEDLDALCLEIEQELNDNQLGGVVQFCQLESTNIFFEWESDQPLAVAMMNFGVDFYQFQ